MVVKNEESKKKYTETEEELNTEGTEYTNKNQTNIEIHR